MSIFVLVHVCRGGTMADFWICCFETASGDDHVKPPSFVHLCAGETMADFLTCCFQTTSGDYSVEPFLAFACVQRKSYDEILWHSVFRPIIVTTMRSHRACASLQGGNYGRFFHMLFSDHWAWLCACVQGGSYGQFFDMLFLDQL